MAQGPGAPVPLGVRATRSDTEWRVGGAAASGIADLAEQFPAQVIDPEVHKLLEEGPGRRRRFLDWGVFHVEHGFLSELAPLSPGAAPAQRGAEEGRQRRAISQPGNANSRRAAKHLPPSATRISNGSLPRSSELAGRFWTSRSRLIISAAGAPTAPLLEALAADRGRDRRYRATQLGPHRSDITVLVDDRPAKDHVSRGQQKLVAAGLMLAQLEIQEQERPGRSALLLDDPAAELDGENLARLMELVRGVPAQLWVTSLKPEIADLIGGRPRVSRETWRDSTKLRHDRA